MVGFLMLELTDVDSFCRNINALQSNVVAVEGDNLIYIKSLISLLTLDLSSEICVKIDSDNEKELKLFAEIIKRYGGRIID